MFFPERGQTLLANEAKRMCLSCPVKKECRDYQERTNSRYGIWAGKTASRDSKAS